MSAKDNKLFVITHALLSPGQQSAQVAHAVTEFLFTYPQQAKAWYSSSNYIVVVEGPDAYHLEKVQRKALHRGIISAPFREPDLADELTAIAFPPSSAARKLLSSYPLAGKAIRQKLARAEETRTSSDTSSPTPSQTTIEGELS